MTTRARRGDAQRAAVVGAILVLIAAAGGAQAQLVLPGAVAPTPEGQPQTVRSRPKPAGGGPSIPAPAAVPNPQTLGGRTLSLDGARSQITFAVTDKQLTVTRLLLQGEAGAGAHTACQVQAAPTPIAVTSLGRPTGVERIQLGYPACPIVFDVLDGAVLADPAQGLCTVTTPDCSVDPAGLWGPSAAEIGPDKVKDLERARGRAEASVRANYKALTAAAGKDRAAIMGYARDQAQFSSTREEICRSYAGEGTHGFCGTKLTEARVAQLRDRLGIALNGKAARQAAKRGGLGLKP